MTLVGYGAQIQRLRQASAKARDQLNISCEVIDLRTLQPWDVDTVANVSTSQCKDAKRTAWVYITLTEHVIYILYALY